MLNLLNFFGQGQQNSLLVKNNGCFSYNGPWVQVYEETLIDRWHVGDFSTAEYTISVDLDSENKEILKALVTATVDKASVVVFARNNTNKDLVEVAVSVNQSYVDVKLTPAVSEDSTSNDGAKAFFTANYFHTQNPPTV